MKHPPRTKTRQGLVHCLAITLGFVLIGLIALKYLQSRNTDVPLKSMLTWQQADAPLGYPLRDGTTPAFDERFTQLSGFELASLPTITRMQHPMGSRHGALTYNAQRYWDMNQKRGGHHTGDDINGIGGMNTDLGDPIYAMASGLVIYRGEPSTGWGNTVITAHKTPDGSTQQIMYAHLERNNVALREIVALGDIIGTVGTANQNYPAHLHLELRNTQGVWTGGGYLMKQAEYLNPMKTLSELSSSTPDSLYTSPLAIIKQENLAINRENLSIKHQKN